MSYFPMFVELKGKSCLIIGGGRIALQKMRVLQDFGADVTVLAPELAEEIVKNCKVRKKEFEEVDLEGAKLVVAATDNQELNHWIAECCRTRGIPYNAVDQIDDCSFIFPSYVKEGEVVAAFSSGGQSPLITQYLKEKIKPDLTEQLGALAACLGGLRAEVKRTVATEAERKSCYREILEAGLRQDKVPEPEEIRAILAKYQKS